MEIHHVAFRTRDPEALARFYCAVLDLPRVRVGVEESTWLKLDHGVLMLERGQPTEPAPPRSSLELVAFRVTPAERANVRNRLCAVGATVEHETEHTTYFRDPDGRRIAVSSHPLTT